MFWTRFAFERLLYRLSVSDFSGEFILKGASLFTVWTKDAYRPTMDLDLLGVGINSQERILGIFRQLCGIPVDEDGLRFDPESVRIMAIRKSGDYHGERVNLLARLGNARIPLQVDIGFGDVVTPEAESIRYPTFLDMPAPRVKASTKQTVVAEKFHAMVFLGMMNSRMKDFYDLYMLATGFDFDGRLLKDAIAATFRRRKTPIPTDLPIALTEEFYNDSIKQKQWKAFVRKIDGGELPEFPVIVELLTKFILPVFAAIAGDKEIGVWKIDGFWEPSL
jgi:hypothetical protein